MKRFFLLMPLLFVGLLPAQEVTPEAVEAQRKGTWEVINYTLEAVQEWEASLFQKTSDEERAAYRKMIDHQRWSVGSLSNTLRFPGDPGFMEAAIGALKFIGEDDRVEDVSLHAYATYLGPDGKEKYYSMLQSFKSSLRDKLNDVRYKEAQMVAILLARPKTEQFCKYFHTMHQVALDSFAAIKGEHLAHLDNSSYTFYQASQMFAGAESGQLKFDRTQLRANFVMKTFADESSAKAYFEEFVLNMLSCTEGADHGWYSGSESIVDEDIQYATKMGKVRSYARLYFDKSSGRYVVSAEFETNRKSTW